MVNKEIFFLDACGIYMANVRSRQALGAQISKGTVRKEIFYRLLLI